MKWSLFLLMLAAFVIGSAQDGVYLVDGSLIKGKVIEVGIEEIIVRENDLTRIIDKRKVLLIHYQNGSAEVYSSPQKDLVLSNGAKKQPPSLPRQNTQNLLSFNMLGLANADLMFFYERLFFAKKMGLGAVAGYNFNPHVNYSINTYMAPLANPKKHGDLGLFVNFYRKPLGEGRTSFFGFSLKYTPISFTSVLENSVTTGTLVTTNLVFTPGQGRQVAVLFHFGKHRQITEQFFVRTMIGIGFFRLTGEYKTQYNYMLNKNSQLPPVEFNVLPKLFVSLNAGYSF
jgi:hypothetical protein